MSIGIMSIKKTKKDLTEIINIVDKIRKQCGINRKIKVKYDERLSANVAYVNTITYTINIGKWYFILSKDKQEKIIKHEVLHLVDYEDRNYSCHDKVFKDLCYKYFGDREIGNSSINPF